MLCRLPPGEQPGDSGNNHPRAANGQYGMDRGRGVAGPRLRHRPGRARGYRLAEGPGGLCLPGMTTTKDPIVGRRTDRRHGRRPGPARPGRRGGPRSCASTGLPGPGRTRRSRRRSSWPPRPAEPDGGGGMWTALLPVLGSLSMVAFAFLVHSLVYLIVLGSMVLAMVGAGLATSARPAPGPVTPVGAGQGAVPGPRGGRSGPGRPRRPRPSGTRRRRASPPPRRCAAVAESGEGLWERRPGDEDFAAVRLGRGAVRGVPAGRAGPGRGAARRGRSGARRRGRSADRGDRDAPRRTGGDPAGTPRLRRRRGRARAPPGSWSAPGWPGWPPSTPRRSCGSWAWCRCRPSGPGTGSSGCRTPGIPRPARASAGSAGR